MISEEQANVLTLNGFVELAEATDIRRQMNMTLLYVRDEGSLAVTMRDSHDERKVLVIRSLYRDFTNQFHIGDIVVCTIRYYLENYFMIDFLQTLNTLPHKIPNKSFEDEPRAIGMLKPDSLTQTNTLISKPTFSLEDQHQRVSLIDIKIGMRNLEVVGRVRFKTVKRDFVMGNNVSVVANFIMFDESTEMKVAMFGQTCETYYNLIEEGKIVSIRNPVAQTSKFIFANSCELVMGNKSTASIIPDHRAERIPHLPPVLKSLEDIVSMSNSRYITFYAKVEFAPTIEEKDTDKKLYLVVSDQNRHRRKILYIPTTHIIEKQIVKDKVYLFERFLLNTTSSDLFIQFCPIFSTITTEHIHNHPLYFEFGQRRQIPQGSVIDLINSAAGMDSHAKDEYSVTAKIEEFGNLYYDKCTNKSCFKKAKKTNEGYECDSCGQLPQYPEPQLNYFGKFTIKDNTGKLEVNYSDKQVFLEIFKVNGEQHMECKKNDVLKFKQLWNEVRSKLFIFTLISKHPQAPNDPRFMIVKAEEVPAPAHQEE